MLNNTGDNIPPCITPLPTWDEELSYIDKSKNCITGISAIVTDVKTIVSQPNNTTLGADDLPPSIMKQLSNKYCIPLTYLINLSVLQVIFHLK